MLDAEFDKLVKQFDMKIRGVIHIGAHYGEEIETYLSHGIEEQLLFEPQPEVYQVLLNNIPEDADKIIPFNCALGSETEYGVEMFVEQANKGQSSSLLKPKLHLQQYPHIQFTGKNTVNVFTLDEIMIGLKKEKYNLINIDVQGYELKVFEGAVKTLHGIDYIYSEVNRAEVYEGCPMVEELDEFLGQFGFERVDTQWIGNVWGDSLFCKKGV